MDALGVKFCFCVDKNVLILPLGPKHLRVKYLKGKYLTLVLGIRMNLRNQQSFIFSELESWEKSLHPAASLCSSFCSFCLFLCFCFIKKRTCQEKPANLCLSKLTRCDPLFWVRVRRIVIKICFRTFTSIGNVRDVEDIILWNRKFWQLCL